MYAQARSPVAARCRPRRRMPTKAGISAELRRTKSGSISAARGSGRHESAAATDDRGNESQGPELGFGSLRFAGSESPSIEVHCAHPEGAVEGTVRQDPVRMFLSTTYSP